MSEGVRPEKHYDAAASNYRSFYDTDAMERSGAYPAHYFRLQHLVKALAGPEIKRVIEVGLGEGTPAFTLRSAGKQVCGFDISQSMVDEARKRLDDKDTVIKADISDPVSYISLLKDGPFDALVAMGVVQHVEKDELVLSNMADMLRPGGRAFIMFRNKLLSLFTFNRYTHDFIVDDLLAGVDSGVRAKVSAKIESIVAMDLPPAKPGAAVSKFHNPFEVEPMMRRAGFTDLRLHWYHYHPAPPMMEQELGGSFRREAIKLEHEPSGWRGMFLASAFVVECVRA